MSSGPFYGKYRGTVKRNIDPLNKGRVLVEVPDVGGKNLLSWATPCLPVTGRNNGMFTVPPEGAGVWVEFENGDANHPVCVGGFYGEGEAPGMARNVPPTVSGFTLQTEGRNGLVIRDGPGGGILIQ